MASESDAGLAVVRERQSLQTRWIAAIAAATAMALTTCMAGLWLFYSMYGRARPETAASVFPGPALQSDPASDLRAWRTAQDRQLHSYAWVDRERGIVQVPIERAMQLVVARGVNAYDPPIAGSP